MVLKLFVKLKKSIKTYILILSLSTKSIDIDNTIDAGANSYLLK